MLVGDALGLLGIRREDVGAETEGRVVRELDRGVLVGDPVDDRRGAEELLAVDVHLGRHVGEHGRCEERTVAGAAGQQRRALLDGLVDLLLQVLGRGLGRDGAEHRVVECRVGRRRPTAIAAVNFSTKESYRSSTMMKRLAPLHA